MLSAVSESADSTDGNHHLISIRMTNTTMREVLETESEGGHTHRVVEARTTMGMRVLGHPPLDTQTNGMSTEAGSILTKIMVALILGGPRRLTVVDHLVACPMTAIMIKGVRRHMIASWGALVAEESRFIVEVTAEDIHQNMVCTVTEVLIVKAIEK